MKHLKQNFLTAFVVSLLLLTGMTGFSQIALCKQEITVSTLPWACNYPLIPSDIDNGSSDYDQLTVDLSLLTNFGPNIVTLTASKTTGESATCTTTVNLTDKSAPVAIVNQTLAVELNGDNIINLLPSMINNGSYDHCSEVTLSISPSVIDCDSPNPTLVFLTVTDEAGNFNQAITTVNITQNKNRQKDLIAAGDITYGIPTANFYKEKITAGILLSGGPYACSNYYDVLLKYNNIPLQLAWVGSEDIGKTFEYTVTDPESLSTCSGTITLVALDCTNALNICDTANKCTPVGDCNSGHTLSDDVEWPCDITIDNAPGYLLFEPTPEKIAAFMNVPVDDIKPELFNNGNSPNQCLLIGENVKADVFELENRIAFTHSFINWMNPGVIYSYTQNVYLNPDYSCDICDTKPWNTPLGDCASGHTDEDIVEWPADITVDFTDVSPYDLSLHPNVHPNNVGPVFNNGCDDVWTITYTDLVISNNPENHSIKRTWFVTNELSDKTYTYAQDIVVNSLLPDSRNVCFATLHNVPVQGVTIRENIVSGQDGCTGFMYDPTQKLIGPFTSETDYLSGLDVEDQVGLKDMVLKNKPLNVFNKAAADMNNDNVVNQLDVLILDSLVSGKITELSYQQGPWKFINTNEFYYKNSVLNNANLSSPLQKYHFTGIKSGDMNDSYKRDEVITLTTPLVTNDLLLNEGEMYFLKLYNGKDFRVKGLQIAIEKNEAFDIAAIISPFFDAYLIDKGTHYLIGGVTPDLDLLNDGYPLESKSPIFKIQIIAHKNAVLHEVFNLYAENNKIVQGGDRPLSKFVMEYSGTIPLSADDVMMDDVFVFPNPTTGKVTLSSKDLPVEKVRIFSFSGTLIETISLLPSETMDVTDLPGGFYNLQVIFSNGRTVHKKLIKI
jgi:hypothetical protein